MIDSAKQAAWEQFCDRLDALDIDPYSPDVPEGHPHRKDVDAIVAEYEEATKVKPPLPPNWEGYAPSEPIDSLPGLAEYLALEWKKIIAWEIADGPTNFAAVSDASQAIRNAFRVLSWLGMDDRPQRPILPQSLREAKQQLDDLERWVRIKHRSGWEPSPRRTTARPKKTSKRRRQTTAKSIKEGSQKPDRAANSLSDNSLYLPEEVSLKQAAEILGVSKDTVLKLKNEGVLQVRNAAPPTSSRPVYRFKLESVTAYRTAYVQEVPSSRRRTEPKRHTSKTCKQFRHFHHDD